MGRVPISGEGNLETARGWHWRLPYDKWWPLAVTGGKQGVGRLILSKTDVFLYIDNVF